MRPQLEIIAHYLLGDKVMIPLISFLRPGANAIKGSHQGPFSIVVGLREAESALYKISVF